MDIFKDKLQHAQIFGRAILTTDQPIPRETVPDGWYCYDMRGTDSDPAARAELVDRVGFHYSGTILSPVPLKRAATRARRIRKADYSSYGEAMDLETFCGKYNLDVPDNPIKFEMRPASPDEAGLFYAQMPEGDDKGGPIETQRSGFDGERRKERSRAEFPPSGGNEAGGVSSDEGQVMDQLRRGVLKDFSNMLRWCHLHGGEIAGGVCTQNYGYVVETEGYRYCLRCNPMRGDYQAYLSCFDKRVQQMGMTEQPPVGRVSFASGERLEFTDPEGYLQTIREELPFHATTGFRFETLTSDPEIRKAADDAIYHLFGEENPRELEDYQEPPDQDMTMDGM